LIAIAKQVHDVTAAIIQLQHDMKEVRAKLNLDEPKPDPKNFEGEKL